MGGSIKWRLQIWQRDTLGILRKVSIYKDGEGIFFVGIELLVYDLLQSPESFTWLIGSMVERPPPTLRARKTKRKVEGCKYTMSLVDCSATNNISASPLSIAMCNFFFAPSSVVLVQLGRVHFIEAHNFSKEVHFSLVNQYVRSGFHNGMTVAKTLRLA